MNEMMTEARPILGTYFRETYGEPENRPQIALESDEDRAIDLSCRACGALALGAGLGFPVGASAPLHFAPPTSDIDANDNDQKKFLTAPQVYSMPGRAQPIKPQRERSDDFKISERQHE